MTTNKTLYIFILVLFSSFLAPCQTIVVEKLPPEINTPEYDEITPVISRDGKTIYFTRVGSPDFEKTIILEGKDISKNTATYDASLQEIFSQIAGRPIINPVKSSFNQDIWIADITNDKVAPPVHPGYPLNSALPNSICSTLPVSDEFLILNQFPKEGGMKKGFSVIKLMKDGTWSQPVPIKIDNYYTDSDGVSATMSRDGTVLILSLLRADTYGSNDLYVSFRKGPYHYSTPVNLGLDINTEMRETTPSLSRDKNTLYFSSNRKGKGGNDIYFVKRLDDSWTKWSFPRRFKYPISSKYDDSQPFFNPNTGYLYFTSKRDGTSDIYRIKIKRPEPEPKIAIRGVVIDSKTNNPVKARLSISSSDKNYKGINLFTQSGKFFFYLDKRLDYTVTIEKEGYVSFHEPLHLTDDYSKFSYDFELKLTPLEEGGNIEFGAIFFERSTAIVLKKSMPAIDKITQILKDNKQLRIRIEGHTDNNGKKDELLELSEKRAKMIKDFLTHNGIDETRIETIGYGDARPIASNDTEETRQKNRRVEIKIVSIGKGE